MKTSLNLSGKTWGKRLRNEKMENEEIWLKPPVSEITESLESELEKRPEEVSVNVILTGIGAARYHFAKSLLRSAYPNLEERDIDKYLVRAGAEREIERLAYLWKMVQNDNGEQS
jgi:protoheme ferro-lyase